MMSYYYAINFPNFISFRFYNAGCHQTSAITLAGAPELLSSFMGATIM